MIELHLLDLLLLPSPVWAEGTVIILSVCVCVCVCVCVLPQNCCLSSIISKSKQAAAPKHASLIQKVALYKVGKLFQAKAARVASKFENKKLIVQILHERLLSQTNDIVLLETSNEEEIMLEISQNCSCVEI